MRIKPAPSLLTKLGIREEPEMTPALVFSLSKERARISAQEI